MANNMVSQNVILMSMQAILPAVIDSMLLIVASLF
jgi:hypothetical protein